ncbi:MAG: hypothetical protein JWM04_1699, partial [Verrucomicrobiales bacterium]|nr:hypothetical protein [Verrucomicrobiales bacterium]
QSSLELVTRCLINSETDLGEVAADGLAQRVVTAFLLSKTPRGETDTARVRLWIAAVENAGPADAAMGERLALAAYQAGDFELAGSWIKRAPKSSLVTQWIQAKLFLREGKLDRAAALMAKIATAFPPSDSTNEVSKFEETLRGKQHYSADGQARGELATLQLARREFAQSLNTLMETGTAYWRDAAYIAERVLTMDELKNYVDSHPVARAKDEEATEHEKNLEQAGDQLRYLLARRLTRENRMEEARAYFPEERLGSLDNLVGALKNSRDRSLDRQARAEAFWTAAVIVRTNGMELMGTELEPDFFVNGGGEQREIVVERKSSITNVAHASEAELERALKPMTNPNKRFHYRYLAAGLGWQAAKMMSDNEENTALVLCRAGGWVKDNDPELADLFYKALVRRCRKLPIGQEADKRRWFPDLDDTGNHVPRGSKPKVTEISRERTESVELEEAPIIQ